MFCFWQDRKYNDDYTKFVNTCLLNKKTCTAKLDEDSMITCEKLDRITNIFKKIPDRYRRTDAIIKLGRKDKDFLLFIFRKQNIVNIESGYRFFMHNMLSELRRIVEVILTDDCRSNELCPTKALLPEYGFEDPGFHTQEKVD